MIQQTCLTSDMSDTDRGKVSDILGSPNLLSNNKIRGQSIYINLLTNYKLTYEDPETQKPLSDTDMSDTEQRQTP